MSRNLYNFRSDIFFSDLVRDFKWIQNQITGFKRTIIHFWPFNCSELVSNITQSVFVIAPKWPTRLIKFIMYYVLLTFNPSMFGNQKKIIIGLLCSGMQFFKRITNAAEFHILPRMSLWWFLIETRIWHYC